MKNDAIGRSKRTGEECKSKREVTHRSKSRFRAGETSEKASESDCSFYEERCERGSEGEVLLITERGDM